MYNFLGNVNLFHGRVEGSTVHLEDVAKQESDQHGGEAKAAVVYARPHLLDVDYQPPQGRPHFRATVSHINAAGAIVKVELNTDAGGVVNVELPHERYRQLQLRKTARVFVWIKDMKVFVNAQSTLGGGI